MYGLFDTPYANLNSVTGNVYYYELNCSVTIPRPETNTSLLLANDNDDCILRQIALAKQAGYNGILKSADINGSGISNDVANTGFPVVIIESHIALKIKQMILFADGTHTDYTLTITGSILAGILIVSFAFFFFTITACCVVFWCGLCCFLCMIDQRTQERRAFYHGDEIGNRNENRNRDELIDSIMRHLEQLQDDVGAQIPLGSNQTRSIPKTRYVQVDGKEPDTCAICVDEFVNGDSIKTLQCGHIFHVNCIDEWLGKYSSVCPLCKSNLRQPVNFRNINNPADSISSDDSDFY